MKPKWTRILFAILISSCAANRIETIRNPDQLTNIKSGHFKGSELACKSPNIQQHGNNNKAFRSVQSALHRPVDLSLHWSRKGKMNTSSTYRSPVQVESILIQRERIDEAIGLDLPEILFPIKNTTDGPIYSIVSLKQKDKENIIVKKYPIKYRIPILHDVYSNQQKHQLYHMRQGHVYLAVLLAGLLSLAALKITPDLAGNLSYWAALNQGKTRFIISVIQIMTGFAGLILGTKMAYMGTQFSDLSKGIVAATFFTSLLLYPVRKSRIKFIRRTYFRQKKHDLVLFLSGFMFMVYAGNYYSGQINSLTHIADKQDYIQQQEYVQMENDQLQNPPVFLQRVSQEQDKPAAPPKDGWSIGLKVFLIILTFGVSAGLGYGVAVLSCELSCSGLNGLAVIVAIGGAALIAALIYISMKAIFNPKHKRTKSLAPA